jgi:hypothetical protein
MRSYIQQLAGQLESEGFDVPRLSSAVSETPIATQVLRNFANFVVKKLGNSGMQGDG